MIGFISRSCGPDSCIASYFPAHKYTGNWNADRYASRRAHMSVHDQFALRQRTTRPLAISLKLCSPLLGRAQSTGSRFLLIGLTLTAERRLGVRTSARAAPGDQLPGGRVEAAMTQPKELRRDVGRRGCTWPQASIPHARGLPPVRARIRSGACLDLRPQE